MSGSVVYDGLELLYQVLELALRLFRPLKVGSWEVGGLEGVFNAFKSAFYGRKLRHVGGVAKYPLQVLRQGRKIFSHGLLLGLGLVSRGLQG